MTEFLKPLFSSDFMPHGFCYLWDPRIVWLHVISDGLIALSYYCIPIILIYFIRKNRDHTFNRIFWMFGAFILACGTSHLMEVWNVWHRSYLIAGVVKAIAAAVSVVTVAMLVPFVPRIISLPGRIHLQAANLKLERRIAERAQFDAPIDAPLRRRVAGAFAVAVLLTVLIGFSSWRSARLAAADADWVAHTHAVMDTLELTTKHAIEAETSGRAFAVTKQDAFLAHYETAKNAVARDMAALRHLTADNPQEQRQLDGLETQTGAAFAFAENIIAKRRQLQTRPDPSEMLETETLVNAISAASQEIRADEMTLLAERTKKSDARQRLTSFLIVGGIFAGAGLWTLAWLAVNREIDVSARARTQLSALNAELEQRVEQRTSALQSEITERKLAEKALQESLAASERAIQDLAEQKFALDQHAIVAVTDLQGTITYVNDRFSAISQYSREEAIGQNYRMMNSGYHPKEYFQKMYDTIGKGQVWHGEIRNRAKDGSIYWVDATIVPLLDSEGKPRQYITIRTDITARKRSEEMRERLAAVVESSDDAIISKTLNGTVTAWNSGAEKLFGYSSAEALGKPMDRLLPLERANEESGILARIAGGARFSHFETVRVRKDGQRVDISATISPVRDSNGVIVGVANIARDITQRKASELEILKLNDELEEKVNVRTAQLETVNKELADQRFAVDQHAIVAVTDVQGAITYVNDKFCAVSQYSREELIGQNHRMLNSGQHPREFFQQMYRTIATKEVWHGEIKNRAKDGSTHWLDTTIVPFVGANGKPQQYVAIRADITEQKLAKEALARQAVELARSRKVLETQLQYVLHSMAEGLVAVDERGNYVLWNPAAERILGMGAADLPIQKWPEQYGLYLPDTVTPFPSEQIPLVRAVRGEMSTTEMFVRNPEVVEGAWIEVSAAPLKDKQGVVCGGVAAIRDITRQKADEREIRKLNEELERRVVERTAQLETANKELEAFSYSVSHDLRAPLRHISGFSQLLVEEFGSNLDPTAQKYVERIQAGTQKMGLLVDELLNLARLGRHALRLQPTGLNSIVAEMLAMLQPQSEGRQVEWTIADLPAVACDPVLVKQIFQNLLSNALKFTRPRAHAVIEVNHQEQADGQVAFLVRDNGIGFNMKYADKLFGVFQRLHREEDFEGTGIGLATVQRIVQKHGGRVWAEGELDKGAAFYFTLGVGKQAESKSDGATAGGRL